MEEVFVGKFSEDDVLMNRDFYKRCLREVIQKNPKYKEIKLVLSESRGMAYYFRNMKVYLIVDKEAK